MNWVQQRYKGADAIFEMIKIMGQRPITIYDLADEVGVAVKTARHYLDFIRYHLPGWVQVVDYAPSDPPGNRPRNMYFLTRE